MEEFENNYGQFQDEKDWQNEQKPARTPMLTVLCILTFIGSGCNALTYFTMPITKNMFPTLQGYYEQLGWGSIYEQNAHIYDAIALVPDWKFFLTALTYVLAVVGAAFMLKMNKLGLHFYIIAQLLGFGFLNFLIGEPLQTGLGGICWSVLFIWLYYTQMRPVLQKTEK